MSRVSPPNTTGHGLVTTTRSLSHCSEPANIALNGHLQALKASMRHGRQWVLNFTRWYNYEHKHSKLRFVTPEQRHTGQDKAILAKRKAVMEVARAQQSVRWGKRQVRNRTPVGPTTLNPEKEQMKQKQKQAA